MSISIRSRRRFTGVNIHDPGVIRRYLLCALSDEQATRAIDETMLRDDDYAGKLELIEEDLIEDYLDGVLTDEEETGFEKRLRNSADLRQRMSLVTGLKQIAVRPEPVEIKESRPAASWWNRIFVLRFAVVFLGIALIGVAVWRLAFVSDNSQTALADLQQSVADERITLGRTTLNTKYSPLIVTRGARSPAVNPESPEFRNAKALLIRADLDNPNAANIQHLLGLMYLAERDLDKAVAEMQEAEKSDPKNAGLLTDIGSVFLEKSLNQNARGSEGERTRNQALALEYTDKSLAIDPDRLPTLFNRALILEELGLVIQAKQAWEEYLKRDSTSEWSAEAGKRLEALEQNKTQSRTPPEIIGDFWAAFDAGDEEKAWHVVSETKEMITGSMVFFQLSKQMVESGTNADREARNLKGMGFIAELEEKNASDNYFSGLYRFYAANGTGNRDRLRQASDEMTAGYSYQQKADWGNALSSFEKARDIFWAIGNRWEADIAEYQACYTLTQLVKMGESSARLRAVAERNRSENNRWPVTLAEGWIGSNFTLTGEHSNALGFNRESLSSATDTADSYNAQRLINQLTHQYYLLGNENETLSMIESNLSYRPKYSQGNRERSRNLLFASQGFYGFGYFSAAAAAASEQLVIARDILNDQWMSHTAYFNIANTYARQGRYDAALIAFDDCFRIGEQFDNRQMRELQDAMTRLQFANLQREMKNCPDALRNYDRVIDYYEPTQFKVSLYEARKGRLQCYIDLDRRDDVSLEMAEVIEIFEKNRNLIADEADRNIFFDREQTVYDIAAQYAFDNLKDPDLAFSYVENSRARSLLARLEQSGTQPTSLKAVQESVSSDTTFLYYVVLPDKTLVWAVSVEGIDVAEIQISQSEIDERVRAYTQTILSRRYSKEISNELYIKLIAPVRSFLDGRKVICIVPDKALFRLPFAALRSEESGKFLVEDFALVYSPSAGFVSRHGRSEHEQGNERFAGIGATSFDRDENPGLGDIPDAEREVKAIADLYDGKALTGQFATRESFWHGLENSDIFHFAGHYVANRKKPEESKLLLADGEIKMSDVLKRQSLRPKLVVLSACDSGVETYYAGEGMIGAARAFLAAGVPMVIGSQWPVDSKTTAELMARFHAERTIRKRDPAVALRSIQSSLLTNSNETNEPYYWAGLITIGRPYQI